MSSGSGNWRELGDREEQWSIWSKDYGAGMPDDIRFLAGDINEGRGLDPYDSYGYSVIYDMYVNFGYDIAEIDVDEIPDGAGQYAEN